VDGCVLLCLIKPCYDHWSPLHLLRLQLGFHLFFYSLWVVNISHRRNGYGVTYVELDLLNGLTSNRYHSDLWLLFLKSELACLSFLPCLCVAAFGTGSIAEELPLFQSTFLKLPRSASACCTDSSCMTSPCLFFHTFEVLGKLRIL